jgi:hypothetical protein
MTTTYVARNSSVTRGEDRTRILSLETELNAQKKTAFVLAGGGSYGAAQVRMPRTLCDHGVQPDLVAASSAGAINDRSTIDQVPWPGQYCTRVYTRLNPPRNLTASRRTIIRKVGRAHGSVSPGHRKSLATIRGAVWQHRY